MGADAHRFSVVQYNNLVGVAHCVCTLGDNQHRHLPVQSGNRAPQRSIGGKVQRAGTVVQHQNLRRADQRPGNRQPLLLSARKVFAALQNAGVQPVRQLAHKFLRLCHPQRLPDLFIAGILLVPLHILPQGTGEQHCPLRHHADFLSQLWDGIAAHIGPIHPDAAAAHLIKAWDEVDQSRFSAAGTTDDAHRLPAPDGQVDVRQRIGARLRIAETDLLKADFRAVLHRLHQLICVVDNRAVHLQHLVDTRCRSKCLGKDDH